MSAEYGHVSGEPVAVYLDRTVAERADLTGERPVEIGRQAVLDYVDAHLPMCYGAMVTYLASPPNVYGVRDAERIVRHLSSHPSLENEQRQTIAALFNENLSRYNLDICTNKKRRIAFVQPSIVELSLPVDGLAEVG